MVGMGCLSKRARTGAGDAAVDGERQSAQAWWSVRCVARPAGCRAAAQSGRSALPWCCGRVGEGAGGAAPSKQVVALPTYAFQRQRYWLEAEKASGDVSTMGLSSAEHPLLGAATPLADSERFLLTGRLSAARPDGSRDHAVFGTVLVPGTGLLELGFAAARAVGATTVSQLTLVAPLVLPEDGAVRVQVQVDAPEAGDRAARAEHL
mgnify:CR=1 FL=1